MEEKEEEIKSEEIEAKNELEINKSHHKFQQIGAKRNKGFKFSFSFLS